MLQRIESWAVEIVLRERETDEDDGKTVHYFATKELGLLAIEWAYQVHLDRLHQRADVESIEEYPNLSDGSWKLPELAGKKITWWRKVPEGFIVMKDYFTCELDVVEREIIGEAA